MSTDENLTEYFQENRKIRKIQICEAMEIE